VLHVFTDVPGRTELAGILEELEATSTDRGPATRELEVRTLVAGAALQFLHTDGAYFLLRIVGS